MRFNIGPHKGCVRRTALKRHKRFVET